MLLGLRTYRVQGASRQPLIDFMVGALREAGCTILHTPRPDVAPFVISFETGAGERMGIVAYVFRATRTPTKNRPDDERSFQIKYGEKDAENSHELWRDPLGIFTTLFLGIDPDDGFFVGADPEMHNPTKFFIRLEFKDRHAEEIKARRWFAWERDHRGSRQLTEPIEVLVGGTKESFLRYIQFERATQGLDQGNRQLIAEKPEDFSRPLIANVEDTGEFAELSGHPLLRELALSSDEVLEIIANARRLKMAVRGWVAEDHLRRTLASVEGVTECDRLDAEGSPDLQLRFRGGAPLFVECKNVLRVPNSKGLARLDFQRTRASKADPCSRYYSPTDFDLVAACLHAVTEMWEFRFVPTVALPAHGKCPGRIASNLTIGEDWMGDPALAFEAAYAARS